MDLQVILLEVTETVGVNQIAKIAEPAWVGSAKGESKEGGVPERWPRRQEAGLGS